MLKIGLRNCSMGTMAVGYRKQSIERLLRKARDCLELADCGRSIPSARSACRWSRGERWLSLCHINGIIYAMRTTIDAAGRIVVPKPLRQVLDLKPGQALEIRAGDGRLEIEIAATPMTLKRRGKSLVAVPETDLPTLTAAEVRETLERIRR